MKKTDTYIPPQSLESERAVLGSIMLRPGALYEIEDTINFETFYADRHAKIFRTMSELAQKREPIDVLTVTHKLEEQKLLEQIGGAGYITDMVAQTPVSANIKYYAEIIHKKYMLRRLISAAQETADIAMSESSEDIEEVLDRAEKKIFEVTSTQKGQKFIAISETLSTAWDRIEKLHENKGELRGVPTGFKALDNMLAGFQNSDLIILAARPSMGKTTLALDVARLAATRHNIPVGIFSLEMDATQLVDRMLSAESRVNAWSLRTGRLSQDSEFSRLRDALDNLSKAPIYIDDQSSNTITKMRSFARRLKAEHGLGLIIVDYLQLMTTTKNYDSMVNQVTEISRSLKGLARDLNVPVIALSQLSRAVESRGGEPRLSDLRDSGSIEQDADVVMFIHNEDKFKEKAERTGIVKLIIAKHRNGPVGDVEVFFDEKTTTFMDVEKASGYEQYAQAGSSGDPFGGVF